MILIVYELRITPWFASHTKHVIDCVHDYGRQLGNDKVEFMSVDAIVWVHILRNEFDEVPNIPRQLMHRFMNFISL